MEAIYSWKLGNIFGKKQFTDINGNVRTNVIKSVELIFANNLSILKFWLSANFAVAVESSLIVNAFSGLKPITCIDSSLT